MILRPFFYTALPHRFPALPALTNLDISGNRLTGGLEVNIGKLLVEAMNILTEIEEQSFYQTNFWQTGCLEVNFIKT